MTSDAACSPLSVICVGNSSNKAPIKVIWREGTLVGEHWTVHLEHYKLKQKWVNTMWFIDGYLIVMDTVLRDGSSENAECYENRR